MRRSYLAPIALVAALFVAACTIEAPTTPPVAGAAGSANRGYMPGSSRTTAMQTGSATAINCVPRHTATGSALIGPAGGNLIIGTHRLVVPAGALATPVLISGTVPQDRPFEIDLQPHGLQFKKAAGLILDASDCVNVPDIVYLIDQYTTSPPIAAIYSNWWHTIACPIWHFSGYAIAF